MTPGHATPRIAGALGLAFALSTPWAWADYVGGQRALQRGDPQTAYREFKEAAEAGDGEAARKLGFILGRGLEFKGGGSIEARPEEAARWYRVGADHGDKICADVLGAMLAVGRGVSLDAEEALRRFDQAGRKVAPSLLERVSAYPEADRKEILAWFMAMRAVMDRELPRLHVVGEPGRATLNMHAEPPHVSLGEGAPPKIAEYLGGYGKDLLDLASPPPGARRSKVVFPFEFVFH